MKKKVDDVILKEIEKGEYRFMKRNRPAFRDEVPPRLLAALDVGRGWIGGYESNGLGAGCDPA